MYITCYGVGPADININYNIISLITMLEFVAEYHAAPGVNENSGEFVHKTVHIKCLYTQ